MDNITALYCKHCKNLIFSRSLYDYRTCGCGKAGIDSKGTRFTGDFENFIITELDPSILVEQILQYDFSFQNSKADEYPKGYHGKFEISENSNYIFFEKLILLNKSKILQDIEGGVDETI